MVDASKIVAIITLSLTLVSGAGYFYGEQRVQKFKIEELERDSKDLTRAVRSLNTNQLVLTGIVSNNSKNTESMKEDFKRMLDMLTVNSKLIDKVANKVGAE